MSTVTGDDNAGNLPRFSPAWLELREGADAAARAADLLEPLRDRLAAPLAIHDLGCGTGSMGRWLAGRLPGPQRWNLYDRDPDLLRHAAAHLPGTATDGAPVTARTRHRDITALTADDLTADRPTADGPTAGLVTASALLDLLTRDEVSRLAAACVGAGYPALLTLSVSGQVELTPGDPLDPEIGAAFNAHQRRRTGDGSLLGPDAVDAAAEAFTGLGATVQIRPTPWRLGPEDSALTSEWLRGWVGAACVQRSDLTAPAAGYLERRLAAAAAGELRALVGHHDLLAYPG